MKISNRKALFDYHIFERIEVGINLSGAEVKAIRLGHADLSGSFVRLIASEAYLVNAKIFPYKYARPEGYEETRTRKLLLHKKEIFALKAKMEGSSLTLVPLSLYTSNHRIKLEIALAKGKKQYEKRALLKKRTIEKDIEQALKDELSFEK